MTVHSKMFDKPEGEAMSDNESVYAIPYRDRKNAYIVVTKVHEPYGKGTEPVVSVGCTLKGDDSNPTWKVHIPESLLDDVIMAIGFAREDEKPLDKAIKGKEDEYEEEIELYETYGGD